MMKQKSIQLNSTKHKGKRKKKNSFCNQNELKKRNVSETNNMKQSVSNDGEHSEERCLKKQKQNASETNSTKQSISNDGDNLDAGCFKKQKKNKSNKVLCADSNWKAFMKTLPKKETHYRNRTKKKNLKTESIPESITGFSGKSRAQPEQEDDDDIWFDNIDPSLLQGPDSKKQKIPVPLVDENGHDGLTNYVAVDCEMVGIGYKGQDSILARVSIVNEFGKCLYDKYVKPREKVTDFRTAVSGIKPHHIINGEEFMNVQKEVADIFKDRIIVGHALSNDMKVLFLGHPRRKIRDTSDYKAFRRLNKGSKPSLKKLADVLLNQDIQTGQHDSVEDARVAMKLYMLNRKEWEKSRKVNSKSRQHIIKSQNVKDNKAIKEEKRRKIRLFKLKNSQKKKRR